MIRPVQIYNFTTKYAALSSNYKESFEAKHEKYMMDCNYELPEKDAQYCFQINDKLNAMLDNPNPKALNSRTVKMEFIAKDGTKFEVIKLNENEDAFKLKVKNSNSYDKQGEVNFIFVAQSPDIYEEPKAFLRQCDDENIVKESDSWDAEPKINKKEISKFLKYLPEFFNTDKLNVSRYYFNPDINI